MSVAHNTALNEEAMVPPVTEAKPAPGEVREGKGQGNRGGLIRRLLLVLVVLAACGIGYWKFQSNKKEDEAVAAKAATLANRAVPVTIAPVIAREMPIYLTALGTVTAYNAVTIKSRVDGQLLTVNVREGQQVKQGQVLATIDAKPYQAAVAQAEGQLAKDQAAANNADAEAGRYTALFKAGVVSKESEQVQLSTAGQSVGTIQADRAAIQAAKVNVGYTRITSPIDGVVGLRQVDAGNIVHAADASGLLLVTQLQPIAVIFTIPEDQLPPVLKLLQRGGKLVVEAYDRSETTHLASGTLLTVDNSIDTTTGTVKAKAVFDNRDRALFPNQFVNVRLILEQRPNSLVIPAVALQTGTEGTFVYTVKEGTPPQDATRVDRGGAATSKTGPAQGTDNSSAKGPQYYVDRQNVVVDLTEGAQVILKSGVAPGDQVVIDGQENLRRYGKVSPRAGQVYGGGAAGSASNTNTTPGTTGHRAGSEPSTGHVSQGQGGVRP